MESEGSLSFEDVNKFKQQFVAASMMECVLRVRALI